MSFLGFGGACLTSRKMGESHEEIVIIVRGGLAQLWVSLTLTAIETVKRMIVVNNLRTGVPVPVANICRLWGIYVTTRYLKQGHRPPLGAVSCAKDSAAPQWYAFYHKFAAVTVPTAAAASRFRTGPPPPPMGRAVVGVLRAACMSSISKGKVLPSPKARPPEMP
jgi:hypothetical protein